MPYADPDRQREYNKLWQRKTGSSKKNYAKVRAERYTKINEMKAKAGCAQCEERVAGKLTYHHRDKSTKVKRVSKLVSENRSWESILAEIKKCDVLCNSCHSALHNVERERSLAGTYV